MSGAHETLVDGSRQISIIACQALGEVRPWQKTVRTYSGQPAASSKEAMVKKCLCITTACHSGL